MNRYTLAAGFFFFWLVVMLAGADFPPPVGFLYLVFLDLVAALLVIVRVPTYMAWSAQARRGRLLLAFLDGALVGLVFAAMTVLLNPVGEPSVQPTLIDRVIWHGVLACVGATNALAVYFFSTRFNRTVRK